ncbi:MAG: hypothetical protein LBC48_02935 [Dysgonamonadaceae bacterium]|jgi:hypothetical protein|nr:hypothetical protein [Dysgonamonadaceae bacterium]
MKLALTFVPIGGLANRIYAVTSAISFCKNYNIRLKVIWFKDWGMGAGFYDLFNLSPIVEHVEVQDARWGDFFKYAKPIKSNFFLPCLYQKLKFDSVYSWNEYSQSIPVEKWYLSQKNAHTIYVLHSYKFYDTGSFSNVLLPVNSIQKRINEQIKLLSPHTIGVHIRRTDLANAIKQSPLSAFAEKMQQEITTYPETNFYVASDSPEEKEKLINLFGDRIITVENVLKRDTQEGIIDALVELYMLASTKKIYGSFQSSYSTLAAEINNVPMEITCE